MKLDVEEKAPKMKTTEDKMIITIPLLISNTPDAVLINQTSNNYMTSQSSTSDTCCTCEKVG